MKRNNNFDFIRHIIASMVIIGHAYVLLGRTSESLVFFHSSISTYAVKIFFVLSGFLIIKSWNYDPSPVQYSVKRFLRIWPALCFNILLVTFVLGPLISSLNLINYFNHIWIKYHLYNLCFYITYKLPGVFENNIYPHAVNGCLWTISVEVAMYISVLMIGTIFRRFFKVMWLVLTIIVIFIHFYVFTLNKGNTKDLIIYATSCRALLILAPYFVIGGCMYLLRNKIIFNIYIAAIVMAIGIWISKNFFHTWCEYIFLLVTSYVVITFAYTPIPFIKNFGKYGDFSYGIYLYGFPVAQTLSYLYGSSISLYSHMLLTLLFSFILAFVSWHLIEKRALRLKPKTKRESAKLEQMELEFTKFQSQSPKIISGEV